MNNKLNTLTDSVNVTIHESKLIGGVGSYAKVQRNTAYIGNIVERIHKNVLLPGGAETLLYVAGLLRDGIMEFLKEGKAVDLLEMGILYLKPQKGMETAMPGIEDVPAMTLSFTPSEAAVEAVKNVTVAADVTKENVPVLNELYDMHTRTKGLSATAGFTVRVSGKGLKVAGENCGVYLAPCAENGTYKTDGSDWILACSADELIDNNGTHLAFNLSSDISAGTFRLIIKTAYGSGSRVNKTTRIGVMTNIVTVQTA